MVEPVKHDSLSEVSTVGGRALMGALVGAVAIAGIGAGLGALVVGSMVGYGTAATVAAVASGLVGLWYGGTVGGLIGGAAGALTGIEKTGNENNAYYAKLRNQERARSNNVGKAKDAGFQEGVMTGYQQAAQDMQAQAQVIYQQGLQEGAQHVVQQLQEQQQQAMAAAEAPKKSHVEKAGCIPCASHAQAAEESKAAAAAAQHGVV